MPVVAVDDIGEEIHLGQDLKDRPGEEGEAFAVVKLPVRGAAFEIVLVVNQVIDDAVDVGLKNPAVAVAPAVHEVKILDILALFPHLPLNGRIERQHNPDVVAFFHQRLRQRAGYVAEAADLDERGRLRSGK